MMKDQVRSLANRIKANREQGDKFVLMLGAGASISSGVPPTDEIMRTLLEKFGTELQGDSTKRRFDLLWQRTPDTERETWLKPYLDRDPSDGYRRLAALIEEGYFDVALTFNFDNLLEKALQAAEFADYKLIIRGETKEDEMQKLVRAREPLCKLLKLHGSLRSSHHFLFDADEMFQYPPAVESMVRDLTSGHIIICGYAFRDDCVIKAFAPQGGSIVSVDLGGVPERLGPLLRLRKSETFAIQAGFDEFFSELHRQLTQPIDPGHRDKLLLNPFKFLESYGVNDRDALMKREDETQDFFERLAKNPDVIVIAGPETCGKTSLVRAGLEPRLDAEKYRGVYLRCQTDLGQTLSLCLGDVPADVGKSIEVPVALRHIAEQQADRRTVLFLDQFERVTGRFHLNSRAGARDLLAFIQDELLRDEYPNLTLVLVVTETEDQPGGKLYRGAHEAGRNASLVECLPLEKQDVAEIITTLAQQVGLEFDPEIIEELTQRYETTHRAPSRDRRFTLAHVQAVCHILAGTPKVHYATFKRAFEKNLEALNQAINVCEIISFVEDFAWPDSAWLRNMIKVPLKESREQIARFIKENHRELLPESPALRGTGAAGGTRRVSAWTP